MFRLITKKIAVPLMGRRSILCTAGAAADEELVGGRAGPWLMLPPNFIQGGRDMVYNFYSPIKDKVVSFNNRGGKEETQVLQEEGSFLVGSSHGWVAVYNSGNREMFLSNPMSGRRIALPPYRGEPFRAVEEWAQPSRLIISCSPDQQDCRAVMILGSQDRLAFCLPGRSPRWTPLGPWYDDPIGVHSHNNFRIYLELVYSAARNTFFGFLSTGLGFGQQELEGWDIADPSRPRMVRLNHLGRYEPSMFLHPSEEAWFKQLNLNVDVPRGLLISSLSRTYILSHSDQLFLVRQYFLNQQEVRFNLLRLAEEPQQEPELCSSLDDLLIFVGINQCFALKASLFPELKPNCIYFSDVNYNFTGQYICVYDYQTKTSAPLYYPSLDQKIAMHLPWITPTFD